MKSIYSYIISAGLILSLAACDSQFEEVNKNPNESETPDPAYVLTATQKKAADCLMSYAMGYHGSIIWVQYWADRDYPSTDQYSVTTNDFTDLWSTGYATIMTNMNQIIAAKRGGNWTGVASILRSWIFLQETLAYGDVPYSEAGKKTTPKYDAQEDILKGLDNDLKKAAESINSGDEAISGDLLYNGDLSKWVRFANSLRLRIALLLSDRDATTAKSIAGEVKDNVLSSNDDIAKFTYTSYPQSNPYYSSDIKGQRFDYVVSQELISTLQNLKDPRIEVYAQPTAADPTKYVGLKNGNKGDKAQFSAPGTYFQQEATPVLFLTYAEVLFAKAEAVARGLISGNAEEYYRQGITASMEQYGISKADITAYLDQASVKYNTANFKESIGIQKWLALYTEGLDAFTEYRRLDYPQLKPADNSMLDAGQLPLRFFYPGTEQTRNQKNYKAAIEHQGPESLTTRLWFDVK